MNIESRPIAELSEDPSNARQHSERNVDAIVASLRRFGQQKPIVIDSNGVVRAGNGTLAAAKRLGWESVDVVVSDLESIDLAAYAIADNRTGELASWDHAVLVDAMAALAADGVDPSDVGFTAEEMEALAGGGTFTELEIVTPEGGGEEVSIEDPGPGEVPEDPVTRLGDVWLCGEHRVLCGDSTIDSDADRLMSGELAQLVYTDPPWGVTYTGGAKKREGLRGDESTALYAPACVTAARVSDAKAPLYLWHAGTLCNEVTLATVAAGYELSCVINWVKNNAQFVSAAHYKGKHEPCIYAHKAGKPARWFGPNNEVTVWDCDRASVNEYHPTQKPVELGRRAIANSSAAGDLVLDLFLGSGATLIAAEQLGRKCYGIEISPAYCDVIVRRYQTATGNQATRESDGALFDDLS